MNNIQFAATREQIKCGLVTEKMVRDNLRKQLIAAAIQNINDNVENYALLSRNSGDGNIYYSFAADKENEELANLETIPHGVEHYG